MRSSANNAPSDGTIFRRTLVVAAAIGLAVALWKLTDLIMLLLASSLVAFIFFKFALFIQRKTKLPFSAALVLAVLLPSISLVAITGLFGAMLAEQFAILFDRVPEAITYVQERLKETPIGREITQQMGSLAPDTSRILGVLQGVASSVSTAVTSLVVVLVAGIYLAAQPRLYGRGILAMIKPAARDKTVSVLEAIATAISGWLKAQGVSMIFVGIFTGAALALVGIPAAPALGLMAGLCEFVPYLGTIVVAIPAILIGFSISPETGMWTAAAVIIVQQIQGNIVTPLVQSTMAELPPALTIFSLIAAGVLLGPMGVILAVPLTVVGLTLVKELWVNEQPAPSNDQLPDTSPPKSE